MSSIILGAFQWDRRERIRHCQMKHFELFITESFSKILKRWKEEGKLLLSLLHPIDASGKSKFVNQFPLLQIFPDGYFQY